MNVAATHPHPPPAGARVAVAMSGGVDSSVTAGLLAEAGYQVVGFTMHVYDAPPGVAASRNCCAPSDVADARRVADQLGIPHRTVDVRERFAREVIDYYTEEYGRGRTPNPCVRCNQHLKYDTLLTMARAVGADTLATGHYARVGTAPTGGLRMARAVDRSKDQSYFLFSVGGDSLRHALFPLGAMTKGEVREHARRLGLATAEKPESMETCFVPDGDHASFVAERLAHRTPSPGQIVDSSGNRLGSHGGVHRFTVGQRRGIGISSETPLYVLRLDAEAGRIVVGPREDLGSAGAVVEEVFWAEGHPPHEPTPVSVQIRHRHAGADATVARDPENPALAQVAFHAPEAAVTPGQAAVFYQGALVLGGGFLREAYPA